MKRFFAGALAAWLMVSMGCRRSHDHAHDDHGREEKTAQITKWSERYEVFAEHKAPVVNKPTRFVTHVSELRTGEPRTQGPIKFVLRQGDGSFEHSQGEPERPGIYIPAIAFPKTGEWQATVLIAGEGGDAAVELGVIRVYGDDHAAAHADFPEPPEGIPFLKEQQWKLLTRVEPASTRTLLQRARVPATVSPKPGTLAHVTPPLPGQVYPPPESKLPVVGERVKAQQTLALLQPSFSEAIAALGEVEEKIARARLAATQAQREYQRANELSRFGAEAVQNTEQARLRAETAQAELDAALATRSSYRQGTNVAGTLPRIELKSPIDGIVISQSGAAVGEHVGTDQPVFTVLNASTVFVEAHVPESAAHEIQQGGDVLAVLPGKRGEFLPLTGTNGGKLIFASPAIEPTTRTVKLLYEVPNESGLFRIGQQLALHIESGRVDAAVAIPDSAIVEEAGVPVAFVQVSGETFQKRELVLGIRDGNFVQVLRGLKEGERVVTHGAMLIRLAASSSALPAHGHAH